MRMEVRRAFQPFITRQQRWAVIVAHRRAGKTVGCVQDLIVRAARCERPDGRFGYLAPLYVQAKDVAWAYLKRFAAPLLAGAPNESELRVDLINGARIRLYGADNADRLRGLYFDGLVLDEYADMAPSVWGEIIRPALADRGGFATFIGTPKGRNSFYQIYDRARLDPTWFSAILRASETGLLAQSELDEARLNMTPEQYQQEFECSFDAAILGAYYGREIAEAEREGRISEDVAWEEDLPVDTAWDLGMGDSTAIFWFQAVGDEIRILDSYESHGQKLSHYAGVVHSKPYKRGKDFVPHDARVRELGTGRTRVEVMKELGLNPVLVPSHKVEDGINAARMSLRHMWFHESRTREALEALRQYRTEYDEKTRAFKNTPKHDWTSHYADAFRYLAMVWREQVRPAAATPKPPVKEIGQWTIEEAWGLSQGSSSRRV